MRGIRTPKTRSGERNSGVRAIFLAIALLGAALGCQGQVAPSVSLDTTPDKHTWFAIGAGTAHALGTTMACQSCHPADTTSFTQIDCGNCHGHEPAVTDRLHLTVRGYTFDDSAACYSCHPTGGKTAFDHGAITNNCAMCHDAGNPFAVLPRANFTHPPTSGNDCGACHNTTDWKDASGAPNGSRDPANDIVVSALLPTYAGTSIVSLTPLDQTLPMPMTHGAPELPAMAMSACRNCHPNADDNVFFPGDLHSSLANLAIGQPSGCGSCHVDSMPIGFVGPTATSPARVPASGEMKHDAVAWANDAPTSTRIVPANCGVCHVSPSDSASAASQATVTAGLWAIGKSGTPTAQYHPALAAAGMPQPTSCLDCHANTRPTAVLDSKSATLPAGLAFDHGSPSAQGDCAACHATGAATAFSAWRLGKFHLTGASSPATCLPCHAGERPTSTAAWTSATYKNSPFDYVTNAVGTTHGDGQDCALCHAGPGTGAWGGTQTWGGGHFNHGPQTVSAATCIACHSTQRPDLQPGATAAATTTALGFDHAANGTGECFGCHQATVTANRFVDYTNPTTRALPGGDWKGGQGYPGSTFASSSDQFINEATTTLVRAGGTANMVTGTTTITTTIYNGMLHVSGTLPAPLAAGPTNTPDNSKCWHCHTNTNGAVTAYRNGQYHSALTSYRATPTGAIAPFPQPTNHCTDCHGSMMPAGIVEKDGSSLWPMDHRAVFATPVTVAGLTAARVTDIDCSVCHKSPGTTWADGTFHPNVGSAVVSDCVSCHYMLIADTAKVDLQKGTDYAMKHASKQLTFQTCQTCHPSAVGTRALLPASVDLWQTGTVHATVTTQPTACLDCHTVSRPGVNLPTQSTWSYALKAGGTATNAGQWMNHGSSLVAGKDCATCHAADAQKTGSTWSPSTSLHSGAPGAKSCQECHGLINGGGGVPGTKNNLPAGLTSATTPTSASAATGIPQGTLSQITHADINVAMRDCNACHTQVGVATSSANQGKEWAQARFHASLTTTNPLVMNTTTGRCSNCHMNVKPTAAYTPQDHGAFTSTPGSQDCSACHSYPGMTTGATAAPNWLGAVGGAPMTIAVGGFTVARPPATLTADQVGIGNLPHPAVATGATCATCHKNGVGGRSAIGYDHESNLIDANCGSCHEAGSDLVGASWNGATATASGAGDTRPFSLAGLVPSTGGNTRALANGFNHFFPADCHECHVTPAGDGATTTGSAYRNVWRFDHVKSRMKNPSTCNMCHAAPNSIPEN